VAFVSTNTCWSAATAGLVTNTGVKLDNKTGILVSVITLYFSLKPKVAIFVGLNISRNEKQHKLFYFTMNAHYAFNRITSTYSTIYTAV
jgi:hypothetical protein